MGKLEDAYINRHEVSQDGVARLKRRFDVAKHNPRNLSLGYVYMSAYWSGDNDATFHAFMYSIDGWDPREHGEDFGCFGGRYYYAYLVPRGAPFGAQHCGSHG